MAQKLSLSLEKLDKLAEDVAKLDVARVMEVSGQSVPSFQFDGYLEEANKKTLAWTSRYFVLRDSCLLSYEGSEADKIVEPQTCICLGKCKVQLLDKQEDLDRLVGKLIDCTGKRFCIHITTRPDKEHILLCAKTEADRAAWVDAVKIARTVTHANMVKLAVENRVLAEEKGAAHVTLSNSTSALAIFSNRDYIQKTPIAGGAEGWLRTAGFKSSGESNKKHKLFGLFGQSELKKLKKRYCILRDSHLLLYDAGDALLKPRGVMYLVGTQVELLEEQEGAFRFRCHSPDVGDYIDFIASSEKRRRRWVFALKIGSRVTYPDFRMLMEEHALLANAVMTPRPGRSQDANRPAPAGEGPSDPMFEDVDLQDAEIDAGAQQPFDQEGNPILRNPAGKLVNSCGIEIQPATPRYSARGEQLDHFNRLLPPGAVPMFTKEGLPIGVGPDGRHYLADGTLVPSDSPHYSSEGTQLAANVVHAADAVAQTVSVALKVKARLQSEQSDATVDILGRTFREMKSDKGFVNADGDVVPAESARRVKTSTGEVVSYTEQAESAQTAVLVVKVEQNSETEEEESVQIGTVEIRSTNTLRDVRGMITQELHADYADFIFLVDCTPLLKYEEASYVAFNCLPEISIRAVDQIRAPPTTTFSTKVDKLVSEEQNRKSEQKEFDEIMSRVRAGTFLKPVDRSDLQ